MGVQSISWFLVLAGSAIGLVVVTALTLWLGRRFFDGLNEEDRGKWDKPLPAPFPRNLVIAIYRRRRRYHRHHRDYYRRGGH